MVACILRWYLVGCLVRNPSLSLVTKQQVCFPCFTICLPVLTVSRFQESEQVKTATMTPKNEDKVVTAPIYTIDLSRNPEDRYKDLAHAYKKDIQGLTTLF